ncbi:DUF1302 family protein [Gilvimarinus polysaccharolyticus]|uniref:DUF1302 family protein n=1 Tax=Gilvimarinus polysaccharolyticus TaxID=863921 RepID=UPI000673572C|nr:DUF1302 family protein [Gilvimarinus polysaccharolyticus]
MQIFNTITYASILTLGLQLPAYAQDFFATVETASQTSNVDADSPWQHKAWLQQNAGFGYRSPAANVNRQSADLTRAETQLYSALEWRSGPLKARVSGSLTQDWLPELEQAGLWNGYEFTPEQRQQRRWRLDLSDTYISWEQGDWWLKAGYQTFAWGEAESLKVTDVLARRDQRWPGQQDLEQTRLPVPAVRATWQNRLDFVALIEPLPDRLPAAYEEFDPYLALRTGNLANDPLLIEQPTNKPGFALRWREHWGGIDTQVLLAEVDSYELAPNAFELNANLQPQITLATTRQQIAGVSLQTVYGNFLVRSEQAWYHNLSSSTLTWVENEATASAPPGDQWRGMVGADYSGIHNLVLTGELTWQRSQTCNCATDTDRWQNGASARATYSAINERLTLQAYALVLPGNAGAVWRLSAKWVWSDRLQTELTVVEYDAQQPEDTLYAYRHNDSLLLNLRWAL